MPFIDRPTQPAEIQRIIAINRAMKTIGQSLNETLDLQQAFQLIVNVARQIISRAEGAVLHRWEEGSQSLIPAAVSGTTALSAQRLTLGEGQGAAGLALREGGPINIQDTLADERILHSEQNPLLRSLLVVPLRYQNRYLGTLSVHSGEKAAFNRDDEDMLQSLATQATVALHNAEMYDNLARALDQERSMHEQLMQADRLASMGRLAASLAHEINNPIQAIQGCLDRARVTAGEPLKQDKYLEMAEKEVRRLAEMVQRMLSYQRRSDEPLTPANLRVLVEDVLTLANKRLQHGRIRVVKEWDSDLPQPAVNTGQLKQVLLNLVLNSVEAMPQGGELTIRGIQPEEGWMRVDVTDTGAGIPSEDLEHLFEPFYTTKHEGSGLGLWISQAIIEAHNGRLTLTSHPGKGTTASIWLPVPSLEPISGGI